MSGEHHDQDGAWSRPQKWALVAAVSVTALALGWFGYDWMYEQRPIAWLAVLGAVGIVVFAGATVVLVAKAAEPLIEAVKFRAVKR